MGSDFLYKVDDGVATLTLNRPEVMNALTFEIYAQLRDLFEKCNCPGPLGTCQTASKLVKEGHDD